MEWAQFHENCVPKFKTGSKVKENSNSVFEVSPDVRNILIRNRNLYLEWQSCRVLYYTLVTRCFKCQGFVTSAKFVSRRKSVRYALKLSHENCLNKENKAKTNRCMNCKIAGKPPEHNVIDRKCLIFIKHLENLINNTDYVGGNI